MRIRLPAGVLAPSALGLRSASPSSSSASSPTSPTSGFPSSPVAEHSTAPPLSRRRRRVLLALLASLALFVVVFRRHVYAGAHLASTYLAFPFLPVPTLDPVSLYDGSATSSWGQEEEGVISMAQASDAAQAAQSALESSSPPAETQQTRPVKQGQAIPRVIHQVRLGGKGYPLRPSWQEAREACVALHPDWQFKLWEDDEADEFVKTEFGPDMFALYRSYEQEIMRTNVLRYMVLYKYGGIYLDLDLKCRVNLDPFLDRHEIIQPPAQPTGVNNAFIASRPGHPFWKFVIDNLPAYHLNWFNSPYVSNMFSTGCQLLSTMHLYFGPRRTEMMQLLPFDQRLNGHVTTFLFEHLGASSWHRSDAQTILAVGKMLESARDAHPALILGALGLSLLVLGAATLAFSRSLPVSSSTESRGYACSFLCGAFTFAWLNGAPAQVAEPHLSDRGRRRARTLEGDHSHKLAMLSVPPPAYNDVEKQHNDADALVRP